MSNRTFAALIVAAALALPAAASAAVVHADFNDLTTGQLSGQSGGSGFTGAWGGSSAINVVSGDLTALASTHFALTQSGTAQSIQNNGAAAADPRTLSTPLTGTIWFSFLVNQSSGSRGGIDLGSSSQRLVAVDKNFYAIVGGSTMTYSNVLTLGQTALILGELRVNANGSLDPLSIWIDPQVDRLGAPTISITTKDIVTSSIGSIYVESYQTGGTFGGIVDQVTLADGAGAFHAVTGVPTPAALPAGLALLGLIGGRRRRHASR